VIQQAAVIVGYMTAVFSFFGGNYAKTNLHDSKA